jgi:hypothetical protein
MFQYCNKSILRENSIILKFIHPINLLADDLEKYVISAVNVNAHAMTLKTAIIIKENKKNDNFNNQARRCFYLLSIFM